MLENLLECCQVDDVKWLQRGNALSTVCRDLKCSHPVMIFWLNEQGISIQFEADLEKITAAWDFFP